MQITLDGDLHLVQICLAMKLSTYLEQAELTASQFADRIGRSVSTVTRAARGEFVPDSETMRRIVEETGGAVTPNDFFDMPQPQPQEAANG